MKDFKLIQLTYKKSILKNRPIHFMVNIYNLLTLSNATISTSDKYCKAAPFLKSRPLEAATPVATSTAVGVARPKAQGHALTHTESPLTKAKKK